MIREITTLVPLPVVHIWDEYKQMISKQEIKYLWEHKIANYLPNYVWRNRLTTTQEKERFFIETHQKFVEFLPQLLKKILDEKAGSE